MTLEFQTPGELAHHDPETLGAFRYMHSTWTREDTPELASWFQSAFGVRPLVCYRTGYRELATSDDRQQVEAHGEVMLLMPSKNVVVFGEPFSIGHGTHFQMFPFTPS